VGHEQRQRRREPRLPPRRQHRRRVVAARAVKLPDGAEYSCCAHVAHSASRAVAGSFIALSAACIRMMCAGCTVSLPKASLHVVQNMSGEFSVDGMCGGERTTAVPFRKATVMAVDVRSGSLVATPTSSSSLVRRRVLVQAEEPTAVGAAGRSTAPKRWRTGHVPHVAAWESHWRGCSAGFMVVDAEMV